jgi:hypothetical protein
VQHSFNFSIFNVIFNVFLSIGVYFSYEKLAKIFLFAWSHLSSFLVYQGQPPWIQLILCSDTALFEIENSSLNVIVILISHNTIYQNPNAILFHLMSPLRHTSSSEDVNPTSFAKDDEGQPYVKDTKKTPATVNNDHHPHQTSAPFTYESIISSLKWILTFLDTVFTSFAYSVAILSSILIAHWGLQQTLSIPFASITWCEYPLISGLGFCQIPAHFPAQVRNNLEFTARLEEIQALAANNADLPQLLAMGEMCIHSMVIQLNLGDRTVKSGPTKW